MRITQQINRHFKSYALKKRPKHKLKINEQIITKFFQLNVFYFFFAAFMHKIIIRWNLHRSTADDPLQMDFNVFFIGFCNFTAKQYRKYASDL